MNVNEIARYGLMAAMAVLAYFMLLAWNEDAAEAAKRAPAPEQVVTLAADPAPSAEALPEAWEPAENAAGDLPTLAAPTAGVTGGAVVIETDVLRIQLDSYGDVVYAALRDHPVALDRPDDPFVILETRGGFTYLARSGLVGKDGLDRAGQRARFQAAQARYELDDAQAVLEVPLVYDDLERGLRVEKRYTLRRGDHALSLSYHVQNLGEASRTLALYGQLKRSAGLAPGQSENGMGPRSYVGAAFTTEESRYEKVDFDDLDDAPFSLSQRDGWLAMLQHYFLTAWVPSAGEEMVRYSARALSDGTYVAEFVQPQTTLAPGSTATLEATLYVGPKAQARLEALSPNLSLTVDYGFLWWIAVPLSNSLNCSITWFTTGAWPSFC